MAAASVKERLAASEQWKLLEAMEAMEPAEREALLADVQDVDFARAVHIFKRSTAALKEPAPGGALLPVAACHVAACAARGEGERARWRSAGRAAMAGGRLAGLLLAGGQGTRLGSTAPKGCYDIGLPSRKSLFQLQAERLLRMETMASREGGRACIPFYIMTSSFTHHSTRKFFSENKFFGLREDQVVFFQQGTLPCFSKDGSVIMASPCQIARAPDGNGGVYAALQASGCLRDMQRRGVEYVECFSVDNALARVADPLFLGFFQESGAPCAAKVVKKAHAGEKVGVFAKRSLGGPTEVVEYSELDPAMAASTDPLTGDLRFQWSNVCMHLFTLDFLHSVLPALEGDGRFHVALKSIPSVEGPVEGVKLEQFIFDAFMHAPKVALFEVLREEEFSPVKNAPGSKFDCPETARRHLLTLHRRWVEAAGGAVEEKEGEGEGEAGIEISPILSYAGEELEDLCKGRVFPNMAVIG